MTRMIITLPEEDKRWLQTISRLQKHSVAETIREAIRQYRERTDKANLKHVVRETAGAWGKSREDSQDYVDRIRSEWEKRP